MGMGMGMGMEDVDRTLQRMSASSLQEAFSKVQEEVTLNP
jgi:hypothetical protein